MEKSISTAWFRLRRGRIVVGLPANRESSKLSNQVRMLFLLLGEKVRLRAGKKSAFSRFG
jgi:hypothetical protein